MARTTRRVPIVPPDADDEAAVAAATALAVRRRLLVLALVGPGVGLMVGLALRGLGGPSSGVYDWLLVALAMTAAVSVLLALRLARGFDRQVLGPARAIGETIARASESTLATTGFSAASGRRARMRATRSRTSAAAASTSRSMRNSMTTWLRSSRLCDVIARTPSMSTA